MRCLRVCSSIAALLVCAGSLLAGGDLDLYYVESGGVVVGEAETFTSRSLVPGETAWLIRPTEISGTTIPEGGPIVANARGGQYVQSLLDESGLGGGGPLNTPEITYRMQIGTPGTYRLFVRRDVNNTNGSIRGKSDSMFADIVELKDGGGGAIADWYEMAGGGNGDFASNPGWDGGGGMEANSASVPNNPMTWDLDAGLYTLRFTQREDGSAVDAWVLQLDSENAPTGDGPDVSETRVPEPACVILFSLGAAASFRAWRRRKA